MLFDISLAEWSLHRTLQKGELDNLDFPKAAKEDYGITAVEYVNSFFKDKAEDAAYFSDLKTRCADLNVNSSLIVVDGEAHWETPMRGVARKPSPTTSNG